MTKKKICAIGAICLFLVFCLLVTLGSIGDILKAPKDGDINIVKRTKITSLINRLNNEAPCQVGAERWFMSAEIIGDTLVYNYELRCNEKTEKFYFKHEKEMRDFSLLSFNIMEGQTRKYGSAIADMLRSNHLVLKYSTVMPSARTVSYIYTADEIEKSAKNTNSEKAFMAYVKTIISIESLSLPIIMDEDGEPVEIAPGTTPSPLTYMILKNIKLKGKDVIFYYSLPEITYSIPEAREYCHNEEYLKYVLEDLCKDSYFKTLINYFAMAKCNMIIRYKGARSLQTTDLKFPYTLLKEHSYIPEYLLDNK